MTTHRASLAAAVDAGIRVRGGNTWRPRGTAVFAMSRVFVEGTTIAALNTPMGLRVVGGVQAQNGAWCPALVDPSTGAAVWYSPAQFPAQYGTWTPRFAVRGDVLFVFNEWQLAALDVNTGQERWRIRTGGDLWRSTNRWKSSETPDNLAIDVLNDGQGGIAIVQEDNDERIHVVRMVDGRAPWQGLPLAGRATAVDGLGILVEDDDNNLQFRDLSGNIVWSHEVRSWMVAGSYVLAELRDGDDGLTCLDTATGQVRWFAEEDSLHGLDEGVALGGKASVFTSGGFSQKLWPIALDRKPDGPGFFGKLLGRGHGDAMPVKRATVDTAYEAGGRFFIVLNDGDGKKELLVVDPSTGKPVAQPHKLEGANWVYVRGGRSTAVARCDYDEQSVLRGFGPDGAPRWERPLEDISEFFCMGDDVVVELPGQVALLDGATGQTRYAYVG